MTGAIVIYGKFDDDVFQNGLLEGHVERLSEIVIENSEAGGDTSIQGTAVPDGEVWNVSSICLEHEDGSGALVARIFAFNSLPDDLVRLNVGEIAVNEPLLVHTNIHLDPGDYIAGEVLGVAADKTLILSYWGYKMLTPEYTE